MKKPLLFPLFDIKNLSSFRWMRCICVILFLFSFEKSYAQLPLQSLSCTGCTPTASNGYATASAAVAATGGGTTYAIAPNTTFTQCATVTSDANGTVGIINAILTLQPAGNTTCTSTTAATRVGSLYLSNAGICSGTEIQAIRKGTNSSTFNNEYVGLTPNTNYIFVIRTTFQPSPCIEYQSSWVKYYGGVTPQFTFNCGTASTTGTFIADGSSHSGTLIVPITGATAGSATFNVSGTGFTGTLTTTLTTSTTSVTIPISYDGSGVAGSRTLTVTSPTGGGICSKNVTVLDGTDSDSDGIANVIDLDDDNDGILDSVECVPTNLITNGDFAAAGTGWTSSFFPTPVTGPLVFPTGTMRILVDNDGNLYPNRVLLANSASLNMVSGKPYNFSADIGIYPGSTSQTSDFGFVLIDATGNIVQTIETFKSRAVGVGNVLITSTVTNYPKSFVSTVTGNYRLAMTWKGGGLGAADDISFDNIIISTICDTDGDGIANNLDLDSDGDGCSDAIEGAGSFTPANLVTSSMLGGNTGGTYTGTSTSPVVSNLGNTVDNVSTSASYGVPTIAGTGQGLGDSQNGAISSQCITCNTGTTAPTLTATTKSNICPTTTADISALVSSTCPIGSSLEWHNVSTGLSSANKIASPTMVGAGTYYPTCFDATNICYSPTPATGVTVTITICISITQPTTQTGLQNVGKSGTVPSDVTPTGGFGTITYTNGSADPACIAPSGASALPGLSNLNIGANGSYSYTTPAAVGTYYFCVKVCDSTTPTADCKVAIYKVVVLPPPCNVGTTAPKIN
jgi:hypothetical protein